MRKLDEAKEILKAIGMPPQQTNDRSAHVLLALANLKEENPWRVAKSPNLRIVDVMEFIANNYGVGYMPNTRETIRKDTLHQFVNAAIAIKNPDCSTRPTNSPNTNYCLSPEFLSLIISYHGKNWDDMLTNFLMSHDKLVDVYRQKRDKSRLDVSVNEVIYSFSPGSHNQLQKSIVEDFVAYFAPSAEVLYLGDAEDKDLIKNTEKLLNLGVNITDHDKLPDVVLYLANKDWLFFIEAVTSVGPISVKRKNEIEEMTQTSKCGKIYVTAFPDRKTYKRFIDALAWDTEVWLAELPDHMIHLNGDKFIGPRK